MALVNTKEITVIPLLLSDCRRKMDLWSGEGLLNPDSAIHEVG